MLHAALPPPPTPPSWPPDEAMHRRWDPLCGTGRFGGRGGGDLQWAGPLSVAGKQVCRPLATVVAATHRGLAGDGRANADSYRAEGAEEDGGRGRGEGEELKSEGGGGLVVKQRHVFTGSIFTQNWCRGASTCRVFAQSRGESVQ